MIIISFLLYIALAIPVLYYLYTRTSWIVRKQAWIRHSIYYRDKRVDSVLKMYLKFWIWDIEKFIKENK